LSQCGTRATQSAAALIARTWAVDATFIDPVAQGKGPAEIDAIICGVQQRFPGHRLRRTSDLDSHHDCVRFSWELADGDGAAVVRGTDIGVVAADNRLQGITSFFDHVAAT
jgi:hypothetical protein